MAEIGWHGECLFVLFWLWISNKFMKAHGMHEDTLLDQSKEEHAAMGGLAAVESERKFVQISLQMRLTSAATRCTPGKTSLASFPEPLIVVLR